jgi:hypothetical protein
MIDDSEKACLIVNNFPCFTAWKFVKLQEVTISTSNKNAYSPGHITIVENGYFHIRYRISLYSSRDNYTFFGIVKA